MNPLEVASSRGELREAHPFLQGDECANPRRRGREEAWFGDGPMSPSKTSAQEPQKNVAGQRKAPSVRREEWFLTQPCCPDTPSALAGGNGSRARERTSNKSVLGSTALMG
jgi:hypothetical protein